MSRLICSMASVILIALVPAVGFHTTDVRQIVASGGQVDPVADPKAGEVKRFEIAKGFEMEFCWIPEGETQLGSPETERDAVYKKLVDNNDGGWLPAEAEGKRGKFRTKGFWLGKYPVTQEEWKAVMGNNPSVFDGKKDNKAKGLDVSRFPVENVEWDDCQEFLEKVNKRDGMVKVFGKTGKFVLPHEDEWEYACRGGKGNKRAFYWGDELNGTQANCKGLWPYGTNTEGQNLERPCAVEFTNGDKYEKHPWGLRHMAGNVWQWCENKYDQSNDRVLRGGSWCMKALYCRSAFRNYNPDRLDDYGFRVCLRLD
jgi:formylglycine-generating enzyme required for sulfatase activity